MGFARTHIGAVATEAAIERARKEWRGHAAVIRNELRARGVHGPLEVLDRAATGSRSLSAPTQLARLAVEMRENGCPPERVRERLYGIADSIVALTFADGAA